MSIILLIIVDNSFISVYITGYRMAAECALNALIAKVVDNKLDAGDYILLALVEHCYFCVVILNPYYCSHYILYFQKNSSPT